MYISGNKPQDKMTATPKKYPQGHFNKKPCKVCEKEFEPKAPSHLTCSQKCADRSHMDRYLQRNYSITSEDYYALLGEQDCKCKICNGEGFTMAKHHKLKLVVDHCHNTGQVRGLLCHNCNRALGLFKDSAKSLSRAINYLEGATTISKESTPK